MNLNGLQITFSRPQKETSECDRPSTVSDVYINGKRSEYRLARRDGTGNYLIEQVAGRWHQDNNGAWNIRRKKFRMIGQYQASGIDAIRWLVESPCFAHKYVYV